MAPKGRLVAGAYTHSWDPVLRVPAPSTLLCTCGWRHTPDSVMTQTPGWSVSSVCRMLSPAVLLLGPSSSPHNHEAWTALVTFRATRLVKACQAAHMCPQAREALMPKPILQTFVSSE